MKKFATVIITVITLLAMGCASVQVAEKSLLNGQKLADGEPIAHINAQNWGFYFLKWPLLTGSVDNPGTISFFSEDSVNVPQTVRLLTQTAKDLKATSVTDIQSTRSSVMLPIPIPFLFYMQSTNVSGNANK
ncbi:MAG: hypothetical protein GX902_04805 [Lentisphaerae bacterium]|jgi:hypothetical protein|nr:hypothetical protein [Lentisphaerota bacterium]